jgi:hypothetical protein
MAEPNSQAQDPTRDSAAGAYFDDLLTRVEKPTAPAPAAATAEPMSRVQQLEAAMAGDDRAFDTPPEDSGARLENQVGASILSGAAKAFFETSDTLTGLSGLGGGGMGNLDYEPKFEDKSRIRNAIETSQQQRENQPGMAGSMNSLARNVAQFTTGMVGFKKIPGLRGKGFTGATVRGAAVGALAFDPHEERLSNFLSKNLAFTKPVTEFLAADENDSRALGRLKAAMESVILDVGVTSVFALGVQAMKLRRGGKVKEAEAVEAKADEEMAKLARQGKWPDTQTQVDEAWERAVTPPADAGQRTDQALGDAWAGSIARRDAEELDISRQAAQDAKDPDAFPGDVPNAPVRGPETPPAGAPSIDIPPARSAGGPGGPGGSPASPPHGGAPNAGANAPPGSGAPLVEAVPGAAPRTALPSGEPTARITVTKENLDTLRKDDAAIQKHGGLQEAIDAGYNFKGRDTIPWQKIQGPDELQAWIGNVLEDNHGVVERARGGRTVEPSGRRVMSDKEVDGVVDQWVRTYNEDPAVVRQTIKAAGDNAPAMVGQMETALLLANRGMADTYELARRIDAGNFAGYGSRAEAEAALKQRLAVAIEMVAAGRAMLAAGGRMVRRARADFQIRADRMAAINAKAMDPGAMVKAILATGGDALKMQRVGQSYAGMLTDYLAGLQAANLLWGWSTHAINFATSAGMLVWRPAEHLIGGAALGAKAVVTGDEALRAQARTVRRRARQEAYETAYQLADGWHAAKEAFLAGDSKLTPHAIEAFTDATGAGRIGTGDVREIAWKPVNGVGSLAYNAWLAANITAAAPFRLLGAADEMVRTTRYRAIIAAKATIDAEDLGLKPGSREFREYIEKRVLDSLDGQGRGIDAEALAEAKATVFGQDLSLDQADMLYKSTFGQNVQWWTANYSPARVIVPFVRTPTNLFRYGQKLTPGLNLLQTEYRNAFLGKKGVEEQARAVGQMMMGTMLVAMAVQMRLEGKLTGGGPRDPKAAKAWKGDGNTPYSFVQEGEDGKKGYLQFNRFDPIFMPFALAADATEIIMAKLAGKPLLGLKEQDDSEIISVAGAVVLSVSHLMKDKLYIKNISDFLEAVTNENKMEPNLRRMATNFVPMATLFRSVAQQSDPYVHEASNWMDQLKSGLPGLSDTAPVRYNSFGEPVKLPGKFYTEQAHAGPLQRALDEMMAHTGTTIQPMTPYDARANLDLRDVKLKDGRTAYERIQELSSKPGKGPSMREALDRLVSSEGFKNLPHGRTSDRGTKEWVMSETVSKYRAAAKAELQRTDPEFRAAITKHAAGIAQALAVGRRNVQVEATRGATTSINQVLAPYGLTLPVPQSQPE